MRLRVDRDLCEENGICVGMAPEAFDFDDEDRLVILNDEVPPISAQLMSQVVASCPRAALWVEQ